MDPRTSSWRVVAAQHDGQLLARQLARFADTRERRRRDHDTRTAPHEPHVRPGRTAGLEDAKNQAVEQQNRSESSMISSEQRVNYAYQINELGEKGTKVCWKPSRIARVGLQRREPRRLNDLNCVREKAQTK